jgi:hypothetical protein
MLQFVAGFGTKAIENNGLEAKSTYVLAVKRIKVMLNFGADLVL